MRLSLQTKLIATATLAASAAIVLLIGFHLSRLPSSGIEPQPASVPGGASSAPETPLELSVFDHPREVPKIRFSDTDGHGLTLADFRGKTVLLNIWATWCVPCRKEMAALDRLQAKLGGDEFLVVPLSIDREGVPAVSRFYRELGLEKLAIYVDPSGRGSQALAIPGVPTTLLIDREGREVARKMGPAEWDGAEMAGLIRGTVAGRSVKGDR